MIVEPYPVECQDVAVGAGAMPDDLICPVSAVATVA
jgi:hypothetical protein